MYKLIPITKTSHMKKAAFSVVFLLAILTGCLKNKSFRTYTITRPVYSLKQEVKDNARVGAPRDIENAGNFALYRNTMYICERGKGIHVVDYSNPSSPANKGFIPVPGNTGLATKNDVLYADCYSFLLVLRIHAQDDVRYEREVADAFTARTAGISQDNDAIHVTLVSKDTTVSEEVYNNMAKLSNEWSATADAGVFSGSIPPNGGGISVGSSMAVFAIVNDFLYTVDQSNLSAFDLSNPVNPVLSNSQVVNSWAVETIFPFSDKLFIGTSTGMFMYGLANPARPEFIGMYQHMRVCDPVIADSRFAFVTLRSGSGCGGAINAMDVLNIENIASPVLVRSYPFSNPHGLSKDGNVLVLCDGTAGLRVLDASDPANIKTVSTIQAGNCIDVVATGQLAFVMLDNAIQIYSYDQQFNVQQLGSISK